MPGAALLLLRTAPGPVQFLVQYVTSIAVSSRLVKPLVAHGRVYSKSWCEADGRQCEVGLGGEAAAGGGDVRLTAQPHQPDDGVP